VGSDEVHRRCTAPNGGSVRVQVVDDVSGVVFEQEIKADLPGKTQFLSPRLFISNGATATDGIFMGTDVVAHRSG
jgi:hypothetical protein